MTKTLCQYTILFISIIIFLSINTSALRAATVLDEIPTPEHKPKRILGGCQPNEYWIVGSGDGLILLEENPPGNWTYTHYPIGNVMDATGPDSAGNIYCSSYVDGIGSAVQIFDCINRIVTNNIFISSNSRTTGLALSPDNHCLYVLNRGWPIFGDIFSPSSSFVHEDTGIVWEIDLQTLTINDHGIVGALPEVIIYSESTFGNDKLLVSTHEITRRGDCYYNLVDILTVQRDLPRETQIMVTENRTSFSNDFCSWSDDEPLVAICCLLLNWYAPDDIYRQGLWIVNTDTNEVVERITVEDIDGESRGVRHAIRSKVYPGRVYVTLGNGGTDWTHAALAIDQETGQLIDPIPTGGEDVADFIYEIPDGRLIITQDLSQRILIIDPS